MILGRRTAAACAFRQLTGSKESCGARACGCCAVIVNEDAVASCMTLTVELDGKNIGPHQFAGICLGDQHSAILADEVV